MKKQNLLLTMAFGALCASCTLNEEFPSDSPKAEMSPYSFNLYTRTADGNVEDSGELTSLHAYAYGDGEFLSYFDISNYTTGSFQLNLPEKGDKKIYFLANHTKLAGLSDNPSESQLQEQVHVAENSSDSAPLFLSGNASVAATGTTTDITLTRSVARIDLNAGEDPLMSITGVEISGTADRTYIFGRSDYNIPAEAESVTYTKTLTTALQGQADGASKQEGVFYVYENGTQPTKVTITGTYNGIATQVEATCPANMKRNFIYTVKLGKVGQEITGTIVIAPWEDGGTIDAVPGF